MNLIFWRQISFPSNFNRENFVIKFTLKFLISCEEVGDVAKIAID